MTLDQLSGSKVNVERALYVKLLSDDAYFWSRILWFVDVNEKYVVFSVKLKKLRSPVNNNNIYFMLLTIGF